MDLHPEFLATVVYLDDVVRGEFAENAIRKSFLPSEIDAIRRAMEPIEKEAARERMTLAKVSLGSGSVLAPWRIFATSAATVARWLSFRWRRQGGDRRSDEFQGANLPLGSYLRAGATISYLLIYNQLPFCYNFVIF